MALELKGLKAKAIKAAANIDRLNVAYDRFNEAAPAHLADVDGLATQIEGMQQDLEFAAQTLGNSVNGSEDSQNKPVVRQTPLEAILRAETPPANPEPPQSIPSTFRAEAEQQIAAGQKP